MTVQFWCGVSFWLLLQLVEVHSRVQRLRLKTDSFVDSFLPRGPFSEQYSTFLDAFLPAGKFLTEQ